MHFHRNEEIALNEIKMRPAKSWPVVLGLISVTSSILLAALPLMRLVTNTNYATSFAGWFLGPVLLFTLYGIDTNMQQSPKNRAYLIAKPGYTTTLRLLAYLSIAVGLAHAWRISSLLSVVS